MKKYLFAAIAAAIAFSSCNVNVGQVQRDNTPMKEKSFPFADVAEKVTVNVPAEVILVQGEETVVNVAAREKTLEEIEVVEKNGRVEIKYTTQKFRLNQKDIKITLTTPYVKDLAINGAAELTARNYESKKSLKIKVNGAGDMELDGIKVPSLKVEINGAGDLEIEGLDCETVHAEVNGAGDLKIAGRADSATVDVNGAGDVNVNNLICNKYIRK